MSVRLAVPRRYAALMLYRVPQFLLSVLLILCSGMLAGCAARVDGKTMEEWIAAARNPPSGPEQRAALSALGRFPERQAAPAIPVLSKELDNPDHEVRLVASESLYRLGRISQPAREQLVKALADPYFGVAVYAAGCLTVQGAETLPAVLDVVATTTGSTREQGLAVVRSLAAEVVAKPELRGRVLTLLTPMLNDPRLDVRWAALDVLKHLGQADGAAVQPVALPAAEQLAATSDSLRLRLLALDILTAARQSGPLPSEVGPLLARAEVGAPPPLRAAIDALR